jgi:hypothetical protein
MQGLTTMPNKAKRFGIVLNGGLGNQLFQIAAGLYISKSHKIRIIGGLGNPRLLPDLLPVSSNLFFSRESVIYENKKFQALTQLASRVLLSVSANYGTDSVSRTIFGMTSFALRILGSLINFRILIGKGVGYTLNLNSTNRGLGIGYFQSYKYAVQPDVFEILRSIKPNFFGEELRSYIALAAVEKPIVVHVRLGDYLNEEKFGILPKTYFTDNLSTLMNKLPDSKIWVFSDDLVSAAEYFPNIEKSKIRLMPEIDSSPVSTLELMRHGAAHLISNSSFGWWGAFLSYREEGIVICPKPWFKSLSDPRDLIPPNWTSVNPW